LPVQNLHTLEDLNKYVAQLLENNSSLQTEVDYLKERCCQLEEEKISSEFDKSAQRKSNITMSEKLIHSGISDRVWRSKLVDMDEDSATITGMDLMVPHEDGNLFNSSKMIKYGMDVDAKNEEESNGTGKIDLILVSTIEKNQEDANFSIEIDIPGFAQENIDGKCGDSKVGLKKS
jgi:FtsZ-binding cell division protein ZapB